MEMRIVAGSIPKYRQLLQILRNQILSGELAPGRQLPTEEELSAKYGVSRGTVRKAVAQLEAERLIQVEHGVGSFVRSAHPNAIPFRFADSTELMERDDKQISYEVVAKEVIPAPIDISERLRIAPNTPVIHVARRKKIDGQPVAYTTRYLPEALCPSLLDHDLSQGTIHDILVDQSELPLLRAEMEIEAHILTAEEAGLMGAQPGDQAIVIERLTYTAPNRPAVWFRAYYKDGLSLSVLIS